MGLMGSSLLKLGLQMAKTINLGPTRSPRAHLGLYELVVSSNNLDMSSDYVAVCQVSQDLISRNLASEPRLRSEISLQSLYRRDHLSS